MGRRRGRRFSQLYASDEAPQANPPVGGPSEEERAVETPPTRRRGRGRPPRRRAAESEMAAQTVEQREEEERRLETPPPTRRRGRGRPPRRRAAESEMVGQQRQEEEDMVEHEAAVPIGEPVAVSGRKGRNRRKHYASFAYNDATFHLEDSVLITPEHISHKPYAAIIKDITEIEGSLTVTGQWFYRPEEAEIGEREFCIARDTRELFYSFHIDDVPAESVMHRCIVNFIPQNKQIPARKKHPGFIVQKVYGAIEKKLWNLTDKEYEENRQQEINILIKKTMDRIGELPDHEPLCNKDVNHIDVNKEPPAGKSNNFEKAEAPASSKPKNFAILSRYNGVTGVETRDRWLDKLLESIPLAWSKEITARMIRADPVAISKTSNNVSSAKVTASHDNEKSYGLHDVVPIIIALERSAYEALGNDFVKYNQKLRHLWYNIKNSSKLRRRLMEKELDPQVLLTMSPDELKAGLISAEKASEPEQPRQLQMTDAPCGRCQEKQVGISFIIQAGHRDRYQLECTTCGHTWFSSYDAIASVSADGSCTPTVTRITAVGARDAKSRSRLVRPETKSSKLAVVPEDDSA